VADEITGVISSADRVQAELQRIQKNVDKATQSALKKVTGKVRAGIKSGMRGKPRWTHRGAWNGRPALDLEGGSRKNPHAGGPGRFSGALMASVKASKRPKKNAEGEYSAVVMGGTKNKAVNAYKRKVEGKYPYFKTGVDKAMPQLPEIWEQAWSKATNK